MDDLARNADWIQAPPGMPQVGNQRLPKRLRARTARPVFGSANLYVPPESEAAGRLVYPPRRSLSLNLSDQDIAERLAAWRKIRPAQAFKRGYYRLYVEHDLQADKGCDGDFLVGSSGATVAVDRTEDE